MFTELRAPGCLL